MNKKIELLSPAKDFESAVAAVNAGADALYIGADRFSARKNAGNTLSEIEKVISYAHGYYCRVYIALNILLQENELEDARRLIYEVHEAGADAVIFQDPAILEMDLPPVRLHASTQFNNYDVQRIKFLSDSGVDRIILARELSLEQIKNISSQTGAELEAFVHGALCVSMSGQCYMSYAVGSRSANRGDCAQPCRKKYRLFTGKGKFIGEEYYLSMKDLDRSAWLAEMIDAGITSLKIEGRLKGPDYVKNITAYYRQKLDAVLEKKSLCRGSSGNCIYTFTPDPHKTFNREFTDFFLTGEEGKTAALRTPKSLGEYAGVIVSAGNGSALVNSEIELVPGDGICYFTSSGLSGGKIQKVESEKIYFRTDEMPAPGEKFYRNHDYAFQKLLESEDSAVRKIDVNIAVSSAAIRITDSDGISAHLDLSPADAPAVENRGTYIDSVRRSFNKTGDTAFQIKSIEIDDGFDRFYRVSELNAFRRQVLDLLTAERRKNYPRLNVLVKKKVPYFLKSIGPDANVINSFSEKFYRERNVDEIERGVEQRIPDDLMVMKSRYCILRETGMCRKNDGSNDYYIENENGDIFSIITDCANCMMYIALKRRN